ncbi:MAG: hypothetical protein AAGB13_04260 [Cyanobacteria bacterium P01_F01_bin.33]
MSLRTGEFEELLPESFYTQRFLSVSDGVHIELCAAHEDSKERPFPSPLLRFRAEHEGKILCEYDLQDSIVQIPLEELEKAILRAKEEVHSEEFYSDV